jgi:hypothetical protein
MYKTYIKVHPKEKGKIEEDLYKNGKMGYMYQLQQYGAGTGRDI